MTNYEKTILNTLIDKYERSKSFTGQNRVNRSFSVKVEKLFPEFADDAEYDTFVQINEAVQDLLDKDHISISKKKNGVIDRVFLNIRNIDSVYEYIKRKPKAETNKLLSDILRKYSSENDILFRYCNEQLERIGANKSVKFFIGNLSEFEIF